MFNQLLINAIIAGSIYTLIALGFSLIYATIIFPLRACVFSDLTVSENLRMGGYTLKEDSLVRSRMNEVFTLFPEIAKYRDSDAGTLSGGGEADACPWKGTHAETGAPPPG